MKRPNTLVFVLVLLLLLLMSALPVYSNDKAESGSNAGGGGDGGNKLSVVCTMFPQYDWVREILGARAENVELTLLLSGNVDLHSYQPSVSDVAKIAKSDLFIHAGGHSDGWVENALKQSANPNMVVVNMLGVIGDGAKTTDIVNVPGARARKHKHKNCKHGHSHAHDHGHPDEHVWLSLKNARKLCGAIAGALSSLDKEGAAEYRSNLEAYAAKLSALDARYRAAVSAAPLDMLLVGDRFPFIYLTEDYGLKHLAAFTGCSAESEASFRTVAALAQQTDKLKLHSIIVTETSDRSIAKTVINNTRSRNQQIRVLNSMHTVTQSDMRSGVTYLSIMESNLVVLKNALS